MVFMYGWLSRCKQLVGRDSGNDFGRFSVPFLEGRISDICAACNFPTRYANLKSQILDIRLKFIHLAFYILCDNIYK